jgi:hypothetical protein
MATPGNKMTGKDAEARGEERVERTAPKPAYKRRNNGNTWK